MNLQREKINFIVYSPLVPIVNGIRSTATNLILELNQICDLHVILIVRENISNDDETPSFLKKNNIIFSEVSTNCRSNLYSLSEKMKMLFPYYLQEEKSIAKSIALLCKSEIALYFGTSFDPIAYHIAKELENPFFFPADSITLFEKNKTVFGSLGKIAKQLKIYIASKIEDRVHKSNYKKIFYVSPKDIECSQLYTRSNKSIFCSIGAQRPSAFKNYLSGTKKELVFTGVMNFGPNEEAALYIIDKILPASNNSFSVKIVGMNPPPSITDKRQENVIVTGAVKDISEFLLQADIFVSPLFSGAGAKNKIIQSLSLGLIVVGSTDSFSGFNTTPPGAYVANSVEEFIDKINFLLTLPPSELQNISESAIRYIDEHYLWSASAKNLLKELAF